MRSNREPTNPQQSSQLVEVSFVGNKSMFVTSILLRDFCYCEVDNGLFMYFMAVLFQNFIWHQTPSEQKQEPGARLLTLCSKATKRKNRSMILSFPVFINGLPGVWKLFMGLFLALFYWLPFNAMHSNKSSDWEQLLLKAKVSNQQYFKYHQNIFK